MPVEKQVAVLYCGTNGLLSSVHINKVQDFQKEFLMVLEMSHQTDVLDVLKKGIINDDVTAIIEKVASEVAKRLAV
jgi:F-type H+-transporting ATPase subunit alpha